MFLFSFKIILRHRYLSRYHILPRVFGDILSNSRQQPFFFKSLELEDLDWMLHGSESTISVEDWKAHTEYNGYKETDCQISWFWEIVGRMPAEQRKILLFFWTSVKYLPVEGFRGLASRLYIYRSMETEDRLPSSHTCFYRLCSRHIHPRLSCKIALEPSLKDTSVAVSVPGENTFAIWGYKWFSF
nr:E3 ubiquitin-protein ligase UPL5-like [Arachis hypogaea]